MMIAPTITSAFATHKIVWGDNPLMRWYTNNSCMVTSNAGNITYGKIEPKSRKTDGFKALVAAMCVAGDLEDSGEAPAVFEIKTYTY
jgi:phage terminase large subunit-like protein